MHLVDFEIAYNSAVNSTTLRILFYVSYGMHPRNIPIEAWNTNNQAVEESMRIVEHVTKSIHERIREQNVKNARYTNKFRKNHNFKVGEKAWLSTTNLKLEDGRGSRKLNPRFCEPLEIVEKINDVTMRLKLSEPMKAKRKHNTFHVSLMKPVQEDQCTRYQEPLPPVLMDDGEDEYEVEAILDTKKVRGTQKYLVKWKGYDNHENTWQTREDLSNALGIVNAFEASRQGLS